MILDASAKNVRMCVERKVYGDKQKRKRRESMRNSTRLLGGMGGNRNWDVENEVSWLCVK